MSSQTGYRGATQNHSFPTEELLQRAASEYNRGVAAERAGNPSAALAAYHSAIQLHPRFFQAWNNLGLLFEDAGRPAEAANAYRQALLAKGNYLAGLKNLARVSLVTGDWLAACDCFDQLAKKGPENWSFHLGRLRLPPCYRSASELDVARERFSGILDELLVRSGAPGPRSATDNRVATIDRHSNFFLAYQGKDDKELQSKYGRLVRNLLQLQGEDPRGNQAIDTTGRRVRIAFASSFFRECTVGHYFKSWIAGLDPQLFEVSVFLLGGPEDSLTNEFRSVAARTVRAEGELSSVIATIASTSPDILVYPELGMHGRTYALAAHRIAPVQCAAWGHPVTTGLPTVDFYFSCTAMESPEAALHYTETLKLLPGLGTRYPRPISGVPVPLEAWGLPSDANLYLFPHPPYKVHPENDPLLCEILEHDPRGMLVLCAGVDRVANALLADRLAECFGKRSIGPDRWRVLPHMSRESFLDLNRQCVAMLDTTRWSGGNITLDALSVGLPVVTRRGEFMRGRQSAGMLDLLGIPELVVADERAYLTIALELGRNKSYRNSLSARIIAAHDQLFDRPEPIVALQAILLELAGGDRRSFIDP